MKAYRWLQVLWPAFLVAGILEMVVFALVDPADLQWLGAPLGLSKQGIYTISFFLFWALTSLSGAMTVLFGQMPAEMTPPSHAANAHS